jgi:hypothetical protein
MEPPTDPAARPTAFGNQLIQVHLWLREQLEELLGGGLEPERERDARTELDSLAALLETTSPTRSGAWPGR